MTRFVLSLGLIVTLVAPPARAAIIRMDIESAANKDVVFENSDSGSAEVFGKSPVATAAFVENDFKGAAGFPFDRVVASGSGLGQYRLARYNVRNAIELASNANAPAESYEIAVPPGKYKRIGLIVASVDGDTSFTIKLRYSDGSETVGWWEADDWYAPGDNRGNCSVVLANMDRVNVKTREIDDANHYQLYEFIVSDVDATKTLSAIVIGNDPHRYNNARESWGAVFAVNGETAE